MTRHWLPVAAFATVAALAAMGPTRAFAEEAKAGAEPDLARAKQLVSQVCAACHGPDGNSPTPAYPSIAAQPADYITVQLAHFKSGVRPNPIMQPIAATLSDADMRALGAFMAQQKARGDTAKDRNSVMIAQTLYRAGDAETGLPACASCHGPDGAGVPKNYPRIGGQHADYTYAQLKAFKAGERGGGEHAAKDPNGSIMATIASRLTDAQMKALADYTAGLR